MNERVIPNSERKRVSSFDNFVEFSSLCDQTQLVILKPPRNDQVKKKKKKKRKNLDFDYNTPIKCYSDYWIWRWCDGNRRLRVRSYCSLRSKKKIKKKESKYTDKKI